MCFKRPRSSPPPWCRYLGSLFAFYFQAACFLLVFLDQGGLERRACIWASVNFGERVQHKGVRVQGSFSYKVEHSGWRSAFSAKNGVDWLSNVSQTETSTPHRKLQRHTKDSPSAGHCPACPAHIFPHLPAFIEPLSTEHLSSETPKRISVPFTIVYVWGIRQNLIL